MSDKLEPIDSTQCQAEVKSGSFMTLGPRKYVRCKNKPTWVAVDVREGKFYGAMSLCNECKKVCEIQMPTASYQALITSKGMFSK